MSCYRMNCRAMSCHASITATVIFFTLLFMAGNCRSFELLIGTGEKDEFSYFAGKTICRTLKTHDRDAGCRLVPAGEAADRLTNLQNGSIDLALVSSKTIYDAVNSDGLFKYITINYDDLRLLMPFYRLPVVLIARQDAGISSVDDLPGKRVNAGVFNSLENQVFKKLMVVKNWHEGDFALYQHLSHAYAQDDLALKNGSIQAMLHAGMHPDNSLELLMAEGYATLVGIDDPDILQLVEEKAGYSRCQIPAGTYPEVTLAIDTLAIETLLITSSGTDDDTVRRVLTSLNESKRQLRYIHPSLMRQQVRVETLNDSYLHPHPSALLFFQSTPGLYEHSN